MQIMGKKISTETEYPTFGSLVLKLEGGEGFAGGGGRRASALK